MAAEQERENRAPATDRSQLEVAQRKGVSWAAMLAWIFGALLLAGFIAYRLVTPFFHRS